MHGEPHQLIVQLGPSGHVDMASKRERLSVKVGNAVGKLIAKRASPQQIADLKEIGALAQSHASKRNWATQVHQSTGLPQGSEDRKLFFDLYDAHFRSTGRSR